MKAITYHKYGPPNVLQVEDIPTPEIKDDQVLVKIKCTAVNSGDWRLRKADPWLARLMFGLFSPGIKVLGTVFSGVIEKVGNQVKNFKTGDLVLGQSDSKMGTYAEFIGLSANGTIAQKPKSLSDEDAAAIIFGGHTALHFLRKADVKEGDKVLIYGASGSVGAACVQLAKYFGALVTAVCGTSNVEMVQYLGADEVIDYKTSDIYSIDKKFDVVVETVGKTAVKKIAALVRKGGRLVLISSIMEGMIQGPLAASKHKIKVIDGVAKATSEDLSLLASLSVEGKLKPTIDRSYPLEQMAEAHEYVEKGHKKGNVVVTIQ